MNLKLKEIIKALIPPIIIDQYRKLKTPGNGISDAGQDQAEYWRTCIGGMWDEIGQLQFDFLVNHNLKPENRFLDIGCGSLRGGVHFIKYLNDGNYYGIDKEQWLLDAGVDLEIPKYGLSNKKIHLIQRDDFNFSVFNTKFDYAIAQSVFTHMPWNSILRCLVNVEKVLADTGKFFVTFFEDETGEHKTEPITHNPGGVTTYPDRDPFHYEFNVFEELAKRSFLKVDYIGDWNHSRNQRMVMFSKPPVL